MSPIEFDPPGEGAGSRQHRADAENILGNSGASAWSGYQKIFFRFVFIYFLLQVIPLERDYYQLVFSLDAGHSLDWLALTRYSPYWGLPAFYSWFLIAGVAMAGAFIWTTADRGKVREYNEWYYWLRVVLRYRLAIGVIGYGLVKLFPVQVPYPSLSNLHTTYGQFLPWKIYYNTIGIIPWYESFLGGVEVLAGLLLLCRNTATFGAGILVGFLANILAANFAYDLGERVYSVYLFTIAVFLLANDVPRLFRLLISQRYTLAEKFTPLFGPALSKARVGLKSLFVLLVLAFALASYSSYRHSVGTVSQNSGLADSYGFYDVREFKLNGRSIPYSLTDPHRWQNVVFEKWPTLSVRIAQPIRIDSLRPGAFYTDNVNSAYDEAGAGERWYYTYTPDTVSHTLLLRNKNPYYPNDSLLLHYSRPDTATIVLSGVDRRGDSLNMVLGKVFKNYLFYVGRRQPVKL